MLFLKKTLSESVVPDSQIGNPQQLPSMPKRSMASLRLQKDLQELKNSELKGMTLCFPDQSSLQTIEVQISPPVGCPYQHTRIWFRLVFPDQYPMEAPKLKCLQRIFHPNINTKGTVCLPLLREDYEPTVSLRSILWGIYLLLSDPSPVDALNPDVGECMKNIGFFRNVVAHTSVGASYKGQTYDCIRINTQDQQESIW